MRKYCSFERLFAVSLCVILVNGCQQADQLLPFELAEGEGATATIGPSGGALSVPPSFSLAIPSGALTSAVAVDVTRRITAPFPSDAGSAVPGTAFDIGPVGTMLNEAAMVEIAVSPDLLGAGQDLRLSVAVLRQDGSVASFGGTYDVTSGVLRAWIDELGPVAAVVALDAVALSNDPPPTLGGGSFPAPAPPAPSGPARTSHGGVEFVAECSPDARQCFSSGLIRLWADQTLRDRLGEQLFLLNPTVSVNLDFVSFDLAGLPTEVVGSVSVSGDLRARFNSTIGSYDLRDGATTGPTTAPTVTPLQVSGNLMIIDQTTTEDGSVEFNEEVEFAITGIGTTEMMTIRLDAELDFTNSDGSTVTGNVIAHIRLRTPQS